MLPKINDPIIDIEVPSLGRIVKFRPFKVKEEKILLLAKQEKSSTQMLNAVMQIAGNCCIDEDVDMTRLPYFDVEYIFIKLRVASVGGTIEYKYGENEARANFEDVTIKGDIKSKPGKVKMSDDMAVIMKYPTTSEMVSLGDEDTDILVDVARICISKIVVGEDITDYTASTVEEQREWVNNLTSDQYQSFKTFFDELPAVIVDSKYKDSEGTVHTRELKGLRNFF